MAVKKEPVAPAPVVSDKKKALETAMQQIEKMYGKGSIMRYGAESTLNVESIPTGSLSLDLALGIGGLPRGRIVEIYGPRISIPSISACPPILVRKAPFFFSIGLLNSFLTQA